MDGPIKQHQMLARGEGLMSGDFGCKDINHMKGPSMGTGGMMAGASSNRGAPPPVKHSKGKMRAQAQPDHGAHR